MVPRLLHLPRLLPRQRRQRAAGWVNDAAYSRSTRVLGDAHGGATLLDLVPVCLAAGLVGDVAVGDGRHVGGFCFVCLFGLESESLRGVGIFLISALNYFQIDNRED